MIHKEIDVKKQFSDEDKNVFKAPNRKEEDKLVESYQKTRSPKIHNQLFEIRKPTISVWAKKYAHVFDSEEDLFSELSVVWLKCVEKYNYAPEIRTVRTKEGHLVRDENNNVKKVFKRTPFNTFLFTSFKNHIHNANKKKYSQKRLDDNGVPVEFGMKSLDSDPSEDNDSDMCLYSTIPGGVGVEIGQIDARLIIDSVSNGDNEVKVALSNILTNSKISDVKQACMVHSGKTNIRKTDLPFLIFGEFASQNIKKIIANSLGLKENEFRLYHYEIYPTYVKYEILKENKDLKEKVFAAIKNAKNKFSSKKKMSFV